MKMITCQTVMINLYQMLMLQPIIKKAIQKSKTKKIRTKSKQLKEQVVMTQNIINRLQDKDTKI